MLPITIAEDVRKQIRYYLEATFEFRQRETEEAFRKFIEDPEGGLFKGPWVAIRRPFRAASPTYESPFTIKPPFHPFEHQAKAWDRLSSNGHTPNPTIVTTGTGSGKTERFLFPILDHVYRAKRTGVKGVKAIILYPMNALAKDQDRRFAKTIFDNSKLRNAGITVGLYTGRYDPANPGASAKGGTSTMGATHGISNQKVQQESPPDILLTNYKMLDFLLMRPQDQGLWRFNEPGVLKYLVLDELHTYDGAQGADVACLIRRLKERLAIKVGDPTAGLCPVGTSATVADGGSGTSGKEKLASFVSNLFEEAISAECIIGESRMEVEEISNAIPSSLIHLPEPSVCTPLEGEGYDEYLLRMATVWEIPLRPSAHREEVELAMGDWLKAHPLFRVLLDVSSDAERENRAPISWFDLVTEVRSRVPSLGKGAEEVVSSFFALVAEAREERSGVLLPLVPTQVQLWVRELRRLGRLVHEEPMFQWLDEPLPGKTILPAFQCSECGESGWAALVDPEQDAKVLSKGIQGHVLLKDPRQIYDATFDLYSPQHTYLVYLSPYDEPPLPDRQGELGFEGAYLCPASLTLRYLNGPCPLTGDTTTFKVKWSRSAIGRKTPCPHCGGSNTSYIGTQSATLSSLAIDEMFASKLNTDPKLLAFTDSVQDASHRAGFFSSRTYHFTLRTALQRIIEEAGPEGTPLEKAGELLLETWKNDPNIGTVKAAIETLTPPDLAEYPPYVEFRAAGQIPSVELIERISERLTWEATSEFGLRMTKGRTIEKMGSAAVGWDRDKIAGTIRELRNSRSWIDARLDKVSDQEMFLWITGLLNHYRERGALYHPYLVPFAAREKKWGKYGYRNGSEGYETHPPRGAYEPRLIVTSDSEYHENIKARSKGNRPPWNIEWTRRALRATTTDEVLLLDVIQRLLDCEAGPFKKMSVGRHPPVYTIKTNFAYITSDCISLICSQTGKGIVRPRSEADLWRGAQSLEYLGRNGRYEEVGFTPRQEYYRRRYRRGALRRVVSAEHTSLLATDAREELEKNFQKRTHQDDPNVLTCTSTLEMGIDIGDLSSTLLCAIPPTTSNYLQRIGRAGRSTGTSLIISIVNQRPHDLFFYGRPAEMLRGKIQAPGCWLDAAAVLARQYLAFCFDTATKEGVLQTLPRSAKGLVEDLEHREGQLSRMLDWMIENEPELHTRFLARFEGSVREDTRERFIEETRGEGLFRKLRTATDAFDRERRDIDNARRRLSNQLKDLLPDEKAKKNEIMREEQILRGRHISLNKTSSLEVLIDHGLLPNYAFPERGVRFIGSVYREDHDQKKRPGKDEMVVDIVRPAHPALRELAPHNTFYASQRHFKVQQISLGSSENSLIRSFAICGACGHMRPKEELSRPEGDPACPQCGFAGEATSQADKGQHKEFLHMPSSYVSSSMEHYESLSGDGSENRERQNYQIVQSFDLTISPSVGAVADDSLPFGVEYRSALVLREVNVGYSGQPQTVPFGDGVRAPEHGFQVCTHCGVVEPPFGQEVRDLSHHRRSCSRRREFEKKENVDRREVGRAGDLRSVYLYRELRSEAIRLLVPLVDDEHTETLIAAIHLGMRLRFEGNPGHLSIAPQAFKETGSDVVKRYLVVMDAVPGGTGYLKALYEEKDALGRPGEGLVDVFRKAKAALESCDCRKFDEHDDTDGCYRCIRSYHHQYQAEKISRERAIVLLESLIDAAEKRTERAKLDDVKAESLFGSILEKRFVERLRESVEHAGGAWTKTLLRGRDGFRFTMPGASRMWELELQPRLGAAQGIEVESQPDFLLSTDDPTLLPIAIFTDGFQFHVSADNRLEDDIIKRRAIISSRRYLVWSLTWEDLNEHVEGASHCSPVMLRLIEQSLRIERQQGVELPSLEKAIGNGFEQLCELLNSPTLAGWQRTAMLAVTAPLRALASRFQTISPPTLTESIGIWGQSNNGYMPKPEDEGTMVLNTKQSLSGDIATFISVNDALGVGLQWRCSVVGRLPNGDDICKEAGFEERWRRFLSAVNLYQFCDNFTVWTTSEALAGTAPAVRLPPDTTMTEEWSKVAEEVSREMRPYISMLNLARVGVPEVEFFNEDVDDDCFAELAWKRERVVVLAKDQRSFASKWQERKWRVVTDQELHGKGVDYLVGMLMRKE